MTSIRKELTNPPHQGDEPPQSVQDFASDFIKTDKEPTTVHRMGFETNPNDPNTAVRLIFQPYGNSHGNFEFIYVGLNVNQAHNMIAALTKILNS